MAQSASTLPDHVTLAHAPSAMYLSWCAWLLSELTKTTSARASGKPLYASSSFGRKLTQSVRSDEHRPEVDDSLYLRVDNGHNCGTSRLVAEDFSVTRMVVATLCAAHRTSRDERPRHAKLTQ